MANIKFINYIVILFGASLVLGAATEFNVQTFNDEFVMRVLSLHPKRRADLDVFLNDIDDDVQPEKLKLMDHIISYLEETQGEAKLKEWSSDSNQEEGLSKLRFALSVGLVNSCQELITVLTPNLRPLSEPNNLRQEQLLSAKGDEIALGVLEWKFYTSICKLIVDQHQKGNLGRDLYEELRARQNTVKRNIAYYQMLYEQHSQESKVALSKLE